MNYICIHDSIISRARTRVYESKLYQNHHIIPIHEDSTSTETVPLTIKEHRIIHLLRYKMGFNLGNLKAYYLLKGNPEIEVNLLICSLAGKIGGKMTKEQKLGIFSDSWDRSAESKRVHFEGLVTPHFKKFPDVAAVCGKQNVLSGIGIHDPNYKNLRSEWASIGANALQEAGTRSGIGGYDWRINNYDLVIENSSKGGKIGGKIVGSRPWWTNGVENKRSHTNPGIGWCRGMTKNKTVNK
jgi:hypothetical protein